MTALARAAVVAAFTFPAMPSGAQGSPASAAVACPQLARAQCTTVTVPLDRSGATPGSVNLAVARVPAPQGPSRGTILFLAGGPGESALASLPELAGIFAALAPGYDLLTFDQRGTGRSSPLFCPSLRGPGSETTVFARCGAQLGPARGFYRTSDSVHDIEAVRQSIGSPQVGLLGVSYGGRVGGEYVRRYPGAVSRMVLDSPSTLEGTDPFTVSRQQAVPRVLRSICGRRSCRSFTRSSSSDLRVVGRRLARKSLRTSLVTPRGRLKVRFGISDLYGLVALTDLDPVSRAQLPGALAAARRGDGAALARALSRTLSALGGAQAQEEGPVSNEVFAATSCAEAPLPWNPASLPDRNRNGAVALRIRQLGAKAFAPFGSRAVTQLSFLNQCVRWPSVRPAPRAPSAGPAIPTLVLAGTEDLRTTLARSATVAAGYPGGRLLPIPGTGHSTVGSDASKCAARAAFGFLGGGPAPAACPRAPREIPTAGRPPARLRSVGGRTRRAKTVRAVRLTIRDVILSVLGTSSPRFGGLRGGRATLLGRRTPAVRLSAYQYVPGVKVSGGLRVVGGGLAGTLRVSGGGTARARLKVGSNGKIRARFSGASPAAAAATAYAGDPLVLPDRPKRPRAQGPLPTFP